MAAMEFSQQEQVKYIKLFFSISPYENISKLPVSIANLKPLQNNKSSLGNATCVTSFDRIFNNVF